MKFSTLLIAFILFFHFIFDTQVVYAQLEKKNYFKLGVERAYIATLGDAEGYSVTTELCRFYTPNINLGVKYRFSSALATPNFIKSFYHKSVSYFEPGFNYYPFNKPDGILYNRIFRRLSISSGPTLMYGQFSSESSWTSTIDPNTGEEINRVSHIATEEKFDIGYFVNLAYEVNISNSLSIGARIDFANYKNNDGYSSYGLILGYRFH